jgi:translation initiation factor 2 subunit 1
MANVPKVGEHVIATVSKVARFGAYCKLLEYDNLEVFLPIREVSSGWIKNIREHVHEGQKVVCSILFYDKEKGTIDVSLKRVTQGQAKEKIRAYNLEKRIAALFSQSIKMAGMYEDKPALVQKALSEFSTYTNLMDNATSDSEEFKKSTLPKKLKDLLLENYEANRKKRRYIVAYTMKLSTFNTMSGVTELKDIITSVKSLGIAVNYIGAPHYRLVAEGEDYSKAEDKIKQAAQLVQSKLKKGIFEIEKEKLKKAKEDIMSTTQA